ncbi:Ubiquinone biosynthesis monooxygenase UbiB [Alkalibacterium sp. AK22]|uniref:ABC1 kinase family protein n=1 Tax=Alkalibacterium sp. AK22 TaxID=1229520 RepID=UPI00044780AF|nr:lipopolysaccharide core heptose(II) kinase RfaY [Alkalibacterium sp. AK22]EXJ23525.1 Ubiquinone biosynthesis monooxygenase UbiB [Alkalibacterium sp. AK22]
MKSNRERLTEIGSVLTSYGFGHIYRTRVRTKHKEFDAENLRLAFEELGPSFIKIGQIISTRQDLLPPSYIREMSKLRDDAPPFPFDDMRRIFEEDFREKLEEVFEWVDPSPLASASVAQVHRARFYSGEEVVIKVQRPEIEENLLRDIQLFSRVVSVAPESVKEMLVDVKSAFKEIEETTKRELDFRNEGQALVQFRRYNKEVGAVAAPRPMLQYTSKRVLVEEYVEGIRGLDAQAISEEGYDKKDIGEKIVYSFLSQIFKDGFFHGDPHPGNIVIKDRQIVFIDFGIVGELSDSVKDSLIKLMRAIVFEDIDQLINLLLQMAITKEKVDRFAFSEDLHDFYQSYISKSFGQIDLSTFFSDVLHITHKYKMVMPNDFILLAKSLTIIEGVVSDLHPDINIMEIASTYIKSSNDISLIDSFSKEKLKVGMYQLAMDSFRLPSTLKRALDTLNNGRMMVHIDLVHFEEKWREVNKMVNRLVFALIIAALILASSVIFVLSEGAGVSIFAIIIFIGAGIMGLWLLVSIIRSGTL